MVNLCLLRHDQYYIMLIGVVSCNSNCVVVFISTGIGDFDDVLQRSFDSGIEKVCKYVYVLSWQ